MTTPFTHEVDDVEFDTFDAHLRASARYYVDAENDFSADVGGTDGPVVTSCRLTCVIIGTLVLTREQLVMAFGERDIAAKEASFAEYARSLLREAA